MAETKQVLRISPRVQIPLAEFQVDYVRSSGPGGQHVNTSSTKAILRWPVTANTTIAEDVRRRFIDRYATRITETGDLILTSQRYRQQRRNLDDCLDKLRAMLVAVLEPPKKRRPTKPSLGANRRRLEAKQRQSDKKNRRSERWSE